MEESKDELVGSFDEKYDTFLKGMIRAFNEVLNVQLEDVLSIEEINQDEVSS